MHKGIVESVNERDESIDSFAQYNQGIHRLSIMIGHNFQVLKKTTASLDCTDATLTKLKTYSDEWEELTAARKNEGKYAIAEIFVNSHISKVQGAQSIQVSHIFSTLARQQQATHIINCIAGATREISNQLSRYIRRSAEYKRSNRCSCWWRASGCRLYIYYGYIGTSVFVGCRLRT